MTGINTKTAAVVNPILSTHSRGYRNAEFVSHEIFPRVPIPARNVTVLHFGKEHFRLQQTRRAPGAATKRVQYGYAGDPVSLYQDRLEAVVPREHLEEAAAVPGIDLEAMAVDMVMKVMDLGLEVAAANIARNPVNYDTNHKLVLTGSDRWTSATSTPDVDIDDAKDAIRASTGVEPNVLLLSPQAYKGLARNPTIKEQFKYTSASSVTTAMLAAYFDIPRVVVGRAVYLPDTAADTDPASSVWGADAILAYAPQAGNWQEPAYGYTYELRGYPTVQAGYYEGNLDGWAYPTKTERRPYIVGAEAGFLFQNAGAPAA